MQTLTIFSCQVHSDGDMVSITDIWQLAQAQGLGDGKLDPRRWGQKPYPKKSGSSGRVSVSGGPGWEFIESLAKSLNVNASDIYQTKRGRYTGGTWAHWQIALAYAKYLDHSLHREVNEIYARYKSGDPTLAAEVIDKQTDVKDVEWIAERAEGKKIRLEFTDCLRTHDVKGQHGYATCTNAIYQPLFGKTAKELREAWGLPAGATPRDHMNLHDLIFTKCAEALSTECIEANDSRGNKACASECQYVAAGIAALRPKQVIRSL